MSESVSSISDQSQAKVRIGFSSRFDPLSDLALLMHLLMYSQNPTSVERSTVLPNMQSLRSTVLSCENWFRRVSSRTSLLCSFPPVGVLTLVTYTAIRVTQICPGALTFLILRNKTDKTDDLEKCDRNGRNFVLNHSVPR